MKKPPPHRRTVSFTRLDDLLQDAQAFGNREPISTGNWTAAQNIEHVSLLIDASVDGFSFSLPLPMRLLGQTIRGWILRKGFKPGIKPPAKAAQPLAPAPDISWDDALDHLATAIGRAKQKRMTAVSPLFGALADEQWESLHCRHAELHFSFIQPRPQ